LALIAKPDFSQQLIITQIAPEGKEHPFALKIGEKGGVVETEGQVIR